MFLLHRKREAAESEAETSQAKRERKKLEPKCDEVRATREVGVERCQSKSAVSMTEGDGEEISLVGVFFVVSSCLIMKPSKIKTVFDLHLRSKEIRSCNVLRIAC